MDQSQNRWAIRQLFNSKPVFYKRGEVIIRSDEENPSYLYLLEKGYVKQYQEFERGEELIYRILCPGSYFPAMDVFDQSENKIGYLAQTPLVVRRVLKWQVVREIKKNPDLSSEFYKLLYNQYDHLLEAIDTFMFSKAKQKIAAMLVKYAGLMGETNGNNTIRIPMPITHQEISSLVGICRETVSREMKKMERLQIVRSNRHYIEIRNFNRLEAFAKSSG